MRAPRTTSGMTLIELMVAMAIGLFLIGGALYVFSQSKATYRTGDSLARLQEAGRFALDTLEPDIRLVRYWGRFSAPGAPSVPAGLAVACGGDVAPWALSVDTPVEVRDDAFDISCESTAQDPRDGSDVLILRHAEPWNGAAPPPLDPARIQIQTSLAQARIFNDGVMPELDADESTTHNVTVNAYYVSNQSSFERDQPSLRRLVLGADGEIDDEEIIPGVENLQVQLGVDTTGDGNVDRYVDGGHALVTPGEPGYDANADVVAVRLWMLVGTPSDDLSWRDTRTYLPPDGDLGELVGGSDVYPSSFRRLQISRTFYLYNRGI